MNFDNIKIKEIKNILNLSLLKIHNIDNYIKDIIKNKNIFIRKDFDNYLNLLNQKREKLTSIHNISNEIIILYDKYLKYKEYLDIFYQKQLYYEDNEDFNYNYDKNYKIYLNENTNFYVISNVNLNENDIFNIINNIKNKINNLLNKLFEIDINK